LIGKNDNALGCKSLFCLAIGTNMYPFNGTVTGLRISFITGLIEVEC
jgi:hypothetical protein